MEPQTQSQNPNPLCLKPWSPKPSPQPPSLTPSLERKRIGEICHFFEVGRLQAGGLESISPNWDGVEGWEIHFQDLEDRMWNMLGG